MSPEFLAQVMQRIKDRRKRFKKRLRDMYKGNELAFTDKHRRNSMKSKKREK